ncbi:hypothetical protein EVAR_41079_1 [Eumeta japonica]|uniref:Uncharacterized protein n=1 Tax=Eumeta variegata TaxID=151549 RepID=A0A4C1XUN5_EUMVA|nr:hypothetical protein EVAR_41079_1 [Eumeta japonica]
MKLSRKRRSGIKLTRGETKEESGSVEPAHCIIHRLFIVAEFRALYDSSERTSSATDSDVRLCILSVRITSTVDAATQLTFADVDDGRINVSAYTGHSEGACGKPPAYRRNHSPFATLRCSGLHAKVLNLVYCSTCIQMTAWSG